TRRDGSRRALDSGSALDLYVALAFVLEHPLVRVADVDPALLAGVLDQLLPVLEDLLQVLLHVLRLALKQREVRDDGGHPSRERGRLQRRLLVELDLRRLGRRPSRLGLREGGAQKEGNDEPNDAPRLHAAPCPWH